MRIRLFFALAALALLPVRAEGKDLQEELLTRHTVIKFGSPKDARRLERVLGGDDEGGGLARLVDELFDRVLETMEVPAPRERVRVFLYPDRAELVSGSRALGLRKIPRAYYHKRIKAVYLSADDVCPGILAHEFSHAVASSFIRGDASRESHEKLARYVCSIIEKDGARE